MSQKVYWKGLELVMRPTAHYITKYNSQLSANLTPTQYTCVQAVLTAILSCLATLPINTPNP